MEIYVNTAEQAFELLYDDIMKYGIDMQNGTKGLYNVSIHLKEPTNRLITTPWRKFSPKYAEREWQWYLSGNPSVHELEKHAPVWKNMHNGNQMVQSNYGWLWNRNGQLDKCIDQLMKDKTTRQAWVTFYDGKEKDNYAFDTPCTIGIGFYIHNNLLNATCVMRSCDLVFGFCNDQYCFTKLQQHVAQALNLEVGEYVHFANNLHIYERHFDMKKDFDENFDTRH